MTRAMLVILTMLSVAWLLLEPARIALVAWRDLRLSSTRPSAAAVLPLPTRQQGREFHVAPSGRADNDGSRERPLDLAMALSPRSPARPGDTIWLHQGVYRGTFESALRGAPGAPIVVRQAPGERAIIDSAPSNKDALLAGGGWTWFWGFEVTSSDQARSSGQTGSWPSDLHRGAGITARGVDLKFINLIVHDLAGGFGIWEDSLDTEANGNIIFYNGWFAPDRGHGHGIYTQNAAPSRRAIVDNILFSQFSHGIHAYGSEHASLDNIELTGNISFNNGALAGDFARDILLGGGRVARNPVVRENFTYGGAATNIGYHAGCRDGFVQGNYFAAALLSLVNCTAEMDGNTISRRAVEPNLQRQYPDNTYYDEPPSGVVIRVRPNRYEAGRANIVVYNWDEESSVRIPLGPFCGRADAAFEVRDAQNFFGESVASGYCGDGSVDVPLGRLTAAAAVGDTPRRPQHTSAEFGVFVLLPSPPRSIRRSDGPQS